MDRISELLDYDAEAITDEQSEELHAEIKRLAAKSAPVMTIVAAVRRQESKRLEQTIRAIVDAWKDPSLRLAFPGVVIPVEPKWHPSPADENAKRLRAGM